MFQIHPDIRKAHTLPGEFYRNPDIFKQVVDRIFKGSWHYVADVLELSSPLSIHPVDLLPNVLEHPIVFTRDKAGDVHCLSNVCTHRGMIMEEKPSKGRLLSCKYHGRCFRLDGSFKSMPAFEGVEGFPSEEDHLPHVPFREWAGCLFAAIHPNMDFDEVFRPITERIGFLPLGEMCFDESRSKDYHVKANWALYCDNYLEGLHIPFVHPALNAALDFDKYEYELFRYANLQIGIGERAENCFELPATHPDYGRLVYAYYFWVFPNIMINVYPWGISLNLVEPLSHNETKVRFRTYLFPQAKTDFEDNAIDQTEMEDEWVVERVQRGIQSDLYKRGRFSPSMEQGVHHFHRLVAEFMT
jgi:choline monooxygenase